VTGYSVLVSDGESRQRKVHEAAEAAYQARQRATPAGGRLEDDLRSEVRALLARASISQRQLAEGLGMSQSSVSHMLTDRAAGLSAVEILRIEELCQVRPGTLYRAAGLIVEPSLEEQVYEIPGITDQTAEAIVAAVQAARGRGYPRTYPRTYPGDEEP
jgi:transcriptional regulator with XRE-family HTH domain